VAEDEESRLAGFLVGFLSQADATDAYVHFVGVAPDRRGSGLGRELYERFFTAAREDARTTIRCVTSPANQDSLAFHEALGFEIDRVEENYDGPGEDRVLLVKRL
jgi:ribosomal protein S18 acetylase RimI-like enzyme